MKVLSIFVDESGDFGKYERHSPFYIFSIVFHEQSFPISQQLQHLEIDLRNLSLSPTHCFHIGPLLRREEDYEFLSIPERRRILNKLVSFTKNINIKYISFFAEKNENTNAVNLISNLSRQLYSFLNNNIAYFSTFDKIILYYDNGQIELGKMLAANLSFLPCVDYRKVQPANYRLFQVADLICSLTLIELKNQKNLLSHSEISFFGNMRDFHKNYLKPLLKKKF